MKKLLFLLLIFQSILAKTSAQENEMGTPWTGRTVSSELGGTNELYLLQQGAIYDKQMDFEKMYFAYDKAVAKDPNSALPLINRAIFKKKFGMLAEAEADYQAAHRLNPYAADLYGYNGPYSILRVLAYDPSESLYKLSNKNRLQNYYDRIDDAYYGERFSNLQLEYLENTIFEIERNNYQEALNLINQFIANNANYALAYDLKGMIQTNLKDYDGATYSLDQALKLRPDYGSAYVNLGMIEEQLGRNNNALDYFDQAIEIQPNLSRAYFARALLKQRTGFNDAAIADYDKIIELEGDQYIEAYLNRGLTRKMMGDYTLAINDINLALENAPNDPKLYKSRGNVYLVYGYEQRAIEDYSLAIQHDPNYAEAYYNRAVVHFKTHDYNSGCHDSQKSLALGFEKAEEMIRYFCTQ